MSRPLPPLNPLRVFECAARHGSFTRAAAELRVSQSAVSRQVAALEAYLDVRLFDREVGGIRLTPAGATYHGRIGPAFAVIQGATDELRAGHAATPLRLGIYATFAAKWLMRRLGDFQHRHPSIDLQISTIVAPVDFSRDALDAAVQFGDGDWPGVTAEYLMADLSEPVCSPALLERGPPIERPADVRAHRLLHSRYRRADWPDWFARHDLPAAEPQGSMTFPSSLLTYQAAVDGLGIAMGQTHLLAAELADGTLIRPLDAPLTRSLAYYLVTPDRAGRSDRFTCFRRWLRTEIDA